jgi:starch synthase
VKRVLHISTECYPAAKSGGLGDVVGALPKYEVKLGVKAEVIIPKYKSKWLLNQNYASVFGGSFYLNDKQVFYHVEKVLDADLGFDLFVIDLPGLFDRPGIYLDEQGYGYQDEPERNISFQRGVLEFLKKAGQKYDLLHCHDHQSGLIPFFCKFGIGYESLRNLPSVFTIHNAQYRGAFHWKRYVLLPQYEGRHAGMLDWDDSIHSLASAIKCADAVTAVSENYMNEVKRNSSGLEHLFYMESHKCGGILNGVDYENWDPKTDSFLDIKLAKSWKKFKDGNKAKFFENQADVPLFSFIGRFAYEKGADLLAGAFERMLYHGARFNVVILGSGDKNTENDCRYLEARFPNNVRSFITYNESLAHQIYAAADFLIMPSRFEPCGLNQMYAMKYGTIPIVRNTGGLSDTVIDIGDNGNGIRFNNASEEDICYSIARGIELFKNNQLFSELQQNNNKLDFSWDKSAKKYLALYDTLSN